ncbi:phage protease [Nitrosovibrio sp. Nv6]|uniref:phage protease n=1 Tax=Nitrosovibrio sp. Nv6 TaxID=1855340 RepID=UPI0008B29C72|nr:phage protease [Nitrosovibrio sp. Nv6]SEO63535.1 Mu-like prophage I protein [Nitrosovibrio sp. Nv6]
MQPPRIIRLSENHTGAVRFLSGLHVTLEEGKTTSWVTVTRTGIFRDPRYGEFEISRHMLEQIVDNFGRRVYGQDIFYDVAHKPENGAAGKVLQLKLEGDRLRAQVEWTPYGVEAIKSKGYAYSSIEYHENFQDNESGQKHGALMMGAGLVLRPCIKRLDPIQLSEASDGDIPTLIHPELQSNLLQEIHTMHKKLSGILSATLAGIVALSEPIRAQLLSAFETAVQPITDEIKAKQLMDAFAESGNKLGEQLAAAGANVKDIKLLIEAPSLSTGLTADDVKKLMADEATRLADDAKKLTEKRDGNIKLLTDTINAATGLSDDAKKELTEVVADLVTPEMSADQVKKLADIQIAQGNKIAAARQLAGMGFQFPAGNVHISVESGNEVKALQESVDKRLGLVSMPATRRFSNTGGQLQAANKDFAEKVLKEFDVANARQLHTEHKHLAAGDGLVSDVAVPAIFERTVIREALYNMIGLQFVNMGTLPFSGSALIPYSYRDTTAASINSTRVYEGGSIPRAGVKQTSETAYPIPQKIAFEVSDELRYLTSNGQLDWDAVSENARNAARIIGEDGERLIFNEILNASDQYATTDVANEAVGTGNGAKSIWPVAGFPVVRPKKVYDLQGNQVGSTLYPITVKSNAVTISEYDGTGTQSAGLYYYMDYNLGEIHFVNELGVASPNTSTHAVVASYSYTTNVYKFDTDQGSVATDIFWDSFLYRYGLRKNVIESDRYHIANFGLMSGTIRTQIEQARSFIESGARNGTDLDAAGNLGRVKDVPNFRTTAPGLAMGDQRVIIGERGQTRYRMMKPWAMGQLQDQRDSNGRFTGKKEAYGDQFIVLHTPTQLKSAYTSIVLYSTSTRISR